MDFLEKLNEKQREAALYKDGPLLILAGAGSGKTSTMTCRIANLVKREGVRPYNILAVTFTNKAAKEMRDRVESMLGPGATGSMWIQTFHSACLRILRVHSDKVGYDKDFVVYDPTDQKTVIKSCVKELRLDEKKFTPNYSLSVISDCKEKNISPEEYARKNGDDFRTKPVADLYQAYHNVLKKNNAMDFDDLIMLTVRLFEKDEETLRAYQQRFQYIMVDEYQDTNYLQYRFVKLLAEGHNNICVVGDDDQCIYQWRGADIKNILDFENDFKGTKVIKLEQNYRSCGNILAAAHSVIERNKGRKDKKLWTDAEDGEKIRYYRADDDKEEARYIAAEIDRLKNSERKFSDFAVLYRTNAQSRVFEEAFSTKEIPYRVLGGLRYYDRKEIKDIIAYMRLVQNPQDDLSLIRIINEPKRGMGAKTLEKLQVLASVRGESLFQTLMDEEIIAGLSAKSSAAVSQMIKAVHNLSNERENLKVSDIYDALLVQTGYIKNLESQNTVEAESRIENLLEFKSVIYDYEKDNATISLAEFMESIALVADIDNHDGDENAVVLMTLHSAKGLEFPIVFMPGMEDGLFPGWRALEKPDGVEEERRLCYVGMTRAMERLYLSGAEVRTMYGKTDYTRESVFLREMDHKLLDGDGIYVSKKTAGPFGSFSAAQFGIGDRTRLEEVEIDEGRIFRPFDQLKEIKAKQATRQTDNMDLLAGDKVSHTKFGEGMVISVEGNAVTVAFDGAGVKKLAIDIAPLKKL